MPRLDCLIQLEPDAWPKLSVIVPACNEAVAIESAAATVSRQDYPDLEILPVNDRSEDNPRSGAYSRVGSFNLLRRKASERTAGFEWLRLQVADDVNAVGQVGSNRLGPRDPGNP